MNAKRKRELFRMIGRRPGFFAPKICCDRESGASFCSEVGSFTVTSTDSFEMYLIASSGFWAYQNEALDILVAPSDSSVILDTGTYCFWASDSEGTPVDGALDAIIIQNSNDIIIDGSRMEGQLSFAIELVNIATLTSFPIISPSTVTYLSAVTLPSITTLDFSPYTIGQEIQASDLSGVTSILLPSSSLNVNIIEIPLITSINASNCSSLSAINITLCASLTSIDLRTLSPISSAVISFSSLVETVLFETDGTPPSLFSVTDAALTEANVNDLMIYLEGLGFVGTMDLTGGTSATPTGAGLTAMNIMIGNGATISVNP